MKPHIVMSPLRMENEFVMADDHTSPLAPIVTAPEVLTKFDNWVVTEENLARIEMFNLDARCDALRPLIEFCPEAEAEYNDLCRETMDARGRWKEFAAYWLLAATHQNLDSLPADNPT